MQTRELSEREKAKAGYAQIKTLVRNKPRDAKEALRRLCCKDLFFLLTEMLGRQDADRDWIFDRCREVQAQPDGYIDLWSREHYKALRLDEPVPTPTGWKLHGELKPGDTLFGPDGHYRRVVALNEIVEDAECYEIEFDDGSRIQANAEHLWAIERRTKKRKKSGGRLYRETVIMRTADIAAHDHKADNRFAIAVNSALRLPHADNLRIDPYVLGAWLGDGHASDGRVTCGDLSVFVEIRDAGYALSDNQRRIGPGERPGAETRTVYGIRPMLRRLGVLRDKHIPMAYLRASIMQRRALLQGLMDTDGHCNDRGTATFTNINERLVDGVYELCVSLGLRPMKRRHMQRAADGKLYPYFQVSFQAYKADEPFRIPRKLARCKPGRRNARHFIVACRRVPSVPMRCIQVDHEDGMYLVGRTMIPTHNSTIITFALTIQDILRNPEITIGLASRTRPQAKDFLKQIKTELETNKKLKALFPDILWSNPENEAPTWSLDDGIVVKRKGNPKEMTIEAWGVIEGQPTGKHYKLLIYDDIIDKDAVTSEDTIKNVTNSWELSLSLGADGGARRIIGTHYHHADTYTTIIQRGAAKPRKYPATIDGEPDGKPVLLSPEYLYDKFISTDTYTFACQYLLDPTKGGSRRFEIDWFRRWNPDPRGMNIYIIVDAANAKRKKSDYTAMWVIGLGADQNTYIIDGLRDKLDLGQRTNALFNFVGEYNPQVVGYEEYGMMADRAHIEMEQEYRNFRFDIQPLGGNISKTDRIAGLIPMAKKGRIFVPYRLVKPKMDKSGNYDVVHEFLTYEVAQWPLATHDDLLDCLARIQDPMMPTDYPSGAGIGSTATLPGAQTDYDVLGH